MELLARGGGPGENPEDTEEDTEATQEKTDDAPLPAARCEHVVFVVIDTLRADALGCYGAEGLLEPDGVRRSPSPRLDELAKTGTRFERVESHSSWTVSSAISYMSGLEPLAHGVNSKLSRALPDDVPFLAEDLQQAGFETAAFICNPMLTEKLGFDRGFRTFRCSKFKPADVAVDAALAWAQSVPEGERLFLYVHLFDPHWPYVPADEEAERFRLPPSSLNQDEQALASMAMMGGDPAAARTLTDWAVWARDAYSACVTSSDRETGRLLDGLEELGILESALTIVTSDHGEEFGEHGAIGHAKQLFVESMHVPLIIAGPGVVSGAVATEPVALRHLAATALSGVQVGGGAGVRGVDLLDSSARASAAVEPLASAVQGGILPRPDGGFRRVEQVLGIVRGDDRVVVAFNRGWDDAHGWVLTGTQSDAGTPRPVAELGDHSLLIELEEGWRERRRAGAVAGSDLEERRRQLETLGYFGSEAGEESGSSGGR